MLDLEIRQLIQATVATLYAALHTALSGRGAAMVPLALDSRA